MLGTGMLILGLFGTYSLAGRALADSSAVWAARTAQVVAGSSVVIFLWPTLKSLWSSGG